MIKVLVRYVLCSNINTAQQCALLQNIALYGLTLWYVIDIVFVDKRAVNGKEMQYSLPIGSLYHVWKTQ